MPKFSIKHAFKYTLGAVASTLVCILPISAAADDLWRFEEQFEGREDVSHQEIVESVYARSAPLDSSAGEGGTREIFEAIFEPGAVMIPMRTLDEDGTVLHSSTIYYSEGELFVQGELSEAGLDVYGEEFSDRSFATVDGNLYTWESNAPTGEMLTRFTGDTVSLVIYSIDWSIAMRSTYAQYLREPEVFTATDSDGITTLRFKHTGTYAEEDFFEGMRFSAEPLWMHALILNIPTCEGTSLTAVESCPEANRTSQEITMEVDYPISIPEIPAEVRALPEGITFEPSSRTASAFMGYL